jgi:hypothetical protein
MAVTHGSATRDLLATRITTDTGATGFFVIGTTGMGTDLVRCPMNATPFGAPSSGTITANAITTTAAIAAGTAAEFEVRDAATGTMVFAGGVAVSGSDIDLTNLTIAVDDDISVSSLTYTAPV